jgi:hypothetical protein
MQQIPSLKKEGPQCKNRPFHNNGDGTLTDVADKARVGGGLHDGKKIRSVAAAYKVDIPAILAK